MTTLRLIRLATALTAAVALAGCSLFRWLNMMGLPGSSGNWISMVPEPLTSLKGKTEKKALAFSMK